MPRYEFVEGSSSKFWEIELDGNTFTTRFGKIGTDGQPSTKVFKSAAEAEKEYNKTIASKTKKGYALVSQQNLSTAAAAQGTNPELEARIEADPDDIEALLVYADWLQQQGDALGEWIALSIEHEQSGSPATKRALDTLLDKHRRAWLGKLVADGAEAFVELEWRHGLLRSAKLRSEYDEEPKTSELLRALLKLPAARFLHTLRIGVNYDEDGQNHYGECVSALVRGGKRASLRELVIGDFEYPDEMEISWTEVGDTSGLFTVLPNLESLHLRGGTIGLGGAPAHPKLKQLILETGGLPRAAVRAVAKADLPALEALEVWFGSNDYGADSTIDDIAPLFARSDLPALTRLALVNAEIAGELAAAVARSKLLPQLKILDLSKGTLDDAGAQVFIDLSDRFRHLEQLDLTENFLSAELGARIREALPNARTETDKDRYDWNDDGRYVSVGE